jgi:hypothetical protein
MNQTTSLESRLSHFLHQGVFLLFEECRRTWGGVGIDTRPSRFSKSAEALDFVDELEDAAAGAGGVCFGSGRSLGRQV